MVLVELAVAFVLFVLSSGLLYHDRFHKNSFAKRAAGVLALISSLFLIAPLWGGLQNIFSFVQIGDMRHPPAICIVFDQSRQAEKDIADLLAGETNRPFTFASQCTGASFKLQLSNGKTTHRFVPSEQNPQGVKGARVDVDIRLTTSSGGILIQNTPMFGRAKTPDPEKNVDIAFSDLEAKILDKISNAMLAPSTQR